MKLMIFGIGDLAELCHFYFTRHGNRTVDGFVVDDAFVTCERLLDCPVIPSSEFASRFGPDDCHMHVAVGYSRGNREREKICNAYRAMGFHLASFVHPTAVCDARTIGDNSLFCENTVVQPYSNVGNGVILRTASFIGHHATVGDYCYIAPGVCMSGKCNIGNRTFIGSGAVLRDGTRVVADCTIGMGAVMTRNAEVAGVYLGQPAKLRKPDQQR